MSAYMETYDYAPERLNEITGSLLPPEKLLVSRMLDLFHDAALPIKVKHLFPNTPNAYYRIVCFIKKSAEAVIINTRTDWGKDGVTDGLNLQIRIACAQTLAQLDTLSESIRTQILHAGDCRFCSPKCEGQRYVFTYADTQYTKCRYLCSNFRFTLQSEADADDLIRIAAAEIACKKSKSSHK